MNENRLIKLFLKDLDPPVNINGLILYPVIGENTIQWKIKNPNNVSYSTYVIEGHLEELLYEFKELTGTEDLPIWDNCWDKYCRMTESDVYINRELSNKINQACDRLNTIKLEDDGKELTADCYVRDWNVEYRDNESLYFHVSLELNNPQIKEIGEIDNDTLSEFLEDFRYNETSLEQETDLVWEIITKIIGDKNMYDDRYMFSVGMINFFDSFGERLN